MSLKNILLCVTSFISISTALGMLLYLSKNPPATKAESISELITASEKGWINLNHLPKSAYDISIKQNLGNNSVKMYFYFDPNDAESLDSHCTTIDTDDDKIQYYCSHQCSWCQSTQTVIVRLFYQGYGDYKAWY